MHSHQIDAEGVFLLASGLSKSLIYQQSWYRLGSSPAKGPQMSNQSKTPFPAPAWFFPAVRGKTLTQITLITVLEFREDAQCAWPPDSRYPYCSSGYFTLICSLQYIYEDLYYSYLSVCPLKRSGTTGNHIFYLISLMWSRERVRLPIWFQHIALLLLRLPKESLLTGPKEILLTGGMTEGKWVIGLQQSWEKHTARWPDLYIWCAARVQPLPQNYNSPIYRLFMPPIPW